MIGRLVLFIAWLLSRDNPVKLFIAQSLALLVTALLVLLLPSIVFSYRGITKFSKSLPPPRSSAASRCSARHCPKKRRSGS